MQGGTKTFCDRLDLMIDYTDASPDDKFSVMCRKQAIDYSDEDFGLTDRDEIFSDVVNYRLGRKGRQTTATLTVPIFGELEMREELVLKGNRGYSVPITSPKNEGQVRSLIDFFYLHLLIIFKRTNRPNNVLLFLAFDIHDPH